MALNGQNNNKKDQKRDNMRLSETMRRVSDVLAKMPDIQQPAMSLTQAFVLIDPVLSMLDRQLKDAETQSAQLISAFGFDDPMVEAINVQLGAIKKAYAQRLALLRKKREESSRAATFLAAQEKDFKEHRRKAVQEYGQRTLMLEEERRRADGRQKRLAKIRQDETTALWLWAALILGIFDKKKNAQFAPCVA